MRTKNFSALCPEEIRDFFIRIEAHEENGISMTNALISQQLILTYLNFFDRKLCNNTLIRNPPKQVVHDKSNHSRTNAVNAIANTLINKASGA